MERFSRTEKLLGREKLLKLKSSKAVLFGAGAVGSFAAEALVRSGLGNLTIVDFDTIQITNINRQLYALESTVGISKVKAAEERLKNINPGCRIITVNRFADENSIPEILSERPDIILDAIDSIGPKVELLAYAHQHSIPVVSSMGAARRLNPLAVHVGDLFKTEKCPLARQLRKALRRRGVTSGIPCVFSDETPLRPDNSEEASGTGGKEKILGSLPAVTGVFGLVLADTAIKILLEYY